MKRVFAPFAALLATHTGALFAGPPSASLDESLRRSMEAHCMDCHDHETHKGGLDLTTLKFNLSDPSTRERWVCIHDRVEQAEMPPKSDDMESGERQSLADALDASLYEADLADVKANGRGPMRRLNRGEFEQNLRDVLQLPNLEVRDILPEDREGHLCNKTTGMLDMSRVELAAYLDAADVALHTAMATQPMPPPVTKYRAVGTDLFPDISTYGNREAMFFTRDNKAISFAGEHEVEVKDGASDETVEMALFRAASWPYIGYPKRFTAKFAGNYQVRFSARAVLQQQGYVLTPAKQSVPMTFRTRRPAGVDIINEVRAEGGIIDIEPEKRVYETTVRLREGESIEYSLLGLPMPLGINPPVGAPFYRYPPFPEGGQPGVAVQWLEVEGPIESPAWPPPSHQVLFDDLGVAVTPKNPAEDAKRLLRRFVKVAARGPVPEEDLETFDTLIQARLEKNLPFREAMLTGYKAFLASGDFIYLHEPLKRDDHFAIASRLSHFLVNSRPDLRLMDLAASKQLRDAKVLREETERLIGSDGFERFVNNFTDYWLNLRNIRRDDPDIRLFPEYRFDDYLVESMERETRAFFTAMIRENMPATALVDANFVFANDRLAKHYGLPPISGSAMRKVMLPKDSPLGGLMTQAAALKVSANGVRTSPVLRGAWVMERLIGLPPPPPANVPSVQPDLRGAKTIRDQLALHTTSKTCASCHAKFDPVGLALESFDVLGGWRTRYRGLEDGERVTGIDRAGHDFSYTLSAAVDTSGKLLDGRSFKNVNDLKAILAADPRQLARNLLHQLTIYSTGTPARYSDRREIESLLDACAKNGYRVRDLMSALVESKIFLGQDGCH